MATDLHTFTGNEVIATEVPKYLNDNFSALNSVDEDIETQLGAKAPLASPTLTGTPKAPTASEGTNTTQIATTAFVASAVKVKSVNGKTGDVVVGEVTDLSISGKTITVTFADGTTKTLTTQDTTGYHTGNATSIGGASATKPAVVVTTYRSGANWYRIWSDGTLEQGGKVARNGTITLLKAFANTDYAPLLQCFQTGSSEDYTGNINRVTTTSFTYLCAGSVSHFSWYAIGQNG